MTELSRRTLTSMAVAGVGVPLLVACGDDGDSATDSNGSSTPSETTTSSGGDPSASESSGGGGGGSEGFASTSEIEVGGGTIFADEAVVVTQPTEGEFRGFDLTCTHQGCAVNDVSDGVIICPCHGSRYSIEDGSPVSGPAPSPLATVEITVEGDQISLA